MTFRPVAGSRWRLGAMLGLTVLLLRVLMSYGVPATLWANSGRYWSPDGHPIGDVSVVAPLLLHLAHSLAAVTVLQAVVGGLCWGLLVAVLVGTQQRLLRGLVLGGLVGLLACSSLVASWDAAVLSESITLSTTALWVAALVLALARPGRWSLAALCGASLLLAGAHPEDALFAVPVTLLVALTRPGMRWRARTALAVVAVLPALWSTTAIAHFENSTSCAPGLTCRGWYALTRLGDLGTDPDYASIAAASGVPSCPSLTAALDGFRATGVMRPQDLCPAASAWLDAGGVGEAGLWLHHPLLAAHLTASRLDALGAPPAYVPGVGLAGVGQGVALASPLVLLLWWRRREDLVLPLLVACCAAGAALVLLADGLEHQRHVLPFTVPVLLAAFAAPAGGWAPAWRRAARAREAAGAATEALATARRLPAADI